MMISRRDLLRLWASAGMAGAFHESARDLFADAPQPSTPVAFKVPAGACDCHTHVFCDPARFPFASGRVYTPEPASVAEMRALHRALHMDRVVVVTPSVYGTDNACTLDAIRQLGARARGVAVIDAQASDAQVDQLNRGGFRGIRLNLETSGISDPAVARRQFTSAANRLAGHGWHIQINTRLSVVEALQQQFLESPVPVVLDHFAQAQASLGTAQPGFDALVRLVRSGKVYVKISAAYRLSTQPDYADVAPLAKALVAANLQRVLWGTDWPHPDSVRVPGRAATDIAPLLRVDDGRLLNQLAVWVPDPAQRKTILVENPAALYGFR
jgi:predicted TIM-barrel fold metal-dependent hydrolase